MSERELDKIIELKADVTTLCAALEAALRWPYQRSMKEHIARPEAIPQEYADRYRADCYDIRDGVLVLKKHRPTASAAKEEV